MAPPKRTTGSTTGSTAADRTNSAEKTTYIARVSIRMGGKEFAPGASIDLDSETGLRYLSKGYVLQPPSDNKLDGVGDGVAADAAA